MTPQTLMGAAMSVGASAVTTIISNASLSLLSATTSGASASPSSGLSAIANSINQNMSSKPPAGLDPAAYILCMIQQKQQQLLDAATTSGRSQLEASGTLAALDNTTTTSAASSGTLDFEELYARG